MMKRKQRPLIISSACGFAAKTSGKSFSRCLTTLANHILRWASLTAQPKAVEDQARFSMGRIYWSVSEARGGQVGSDCRGGLC